MFLQTINTENFIPLIILLGIVILFSTIIFAFRIKISAVFAVQILIGIIIGPWFNQFIGGQGMDRVVDVLYVIGFVLLMFLSGYDCNYDVLKEKCEIPIVRNVVKIFFINVSIKFWKFIFLLGLLR